MALIAHSSINNSFFEEPTLSQETSLAKNLVTPLLALLNSDQIKPTQGERNEYRGLELSLRNIRHESSPLLLGNALIRLAQDYLYSATFQTLALKILNTLKDSNLAQAGAAAKLWNVFHGTGGRLGDHLIHQFRRVTQSETLLPMATAISLGNVLGQATRAGISIWMRGGSVARLGGKVAVHATASAGGLLGNASMFPLGLGAGRMLLGRSSGLETWQSYGQSFYHGLSLMGTLGAAHWVGRSLRWSLHGMRFSCGIAQATHFQSLAKLTQVTMPLSLELGGLTLMSWAGNQSALMTHHMASALGMSLECRLGSGLGRVAAPKLHHLGEQLTRQTYQVMSQGLASTFRQFPKPNRPITLESATVAASVGTYHGVRTFNTPAQETVMQSIDHSAGTRGDRTVGASVDHSHFGPARTQVKKGTSRDALAALIDTPTILRIINFEGLETALQTKLFEQLPEFQRDRIKALRERLTSDAAQNDPSFWQRRENLMPTMVVLNDLAHFRSSDRWVADVWDAGFENSLGNSAQRRSLGSHIGFQRQSIGRVWDHLIGHA